LRKDMEALRAAYEARLQALEQRLKSAEAALAAAPCGRAERAASGRGLAAAGGRAATADCHCGTTRRHRCRRWRREFVQPRGLAHPLGALRAHVARSGAVRAARLSVAGRCADRPGTRGFSLSETELGLAASIDPWLRGAAAISFAPDNTVEVEEAFVQTTSLGNGLSLKAGRFFSGIGYLNPQHSHTWDFVDSPLAYQAMLGGQYGDDGLQLTWLPPIDQYVELGVEVGRGRTFPGSDSNRNGPAWSRSPRTRAATSARATAGAPASRCSTRRRATRGSLRPTPPATASRSRSAAARASGSPTRSGSGRRTATRRARTSSCRASICRAREAAI
jgi:hypothetical protein